MLWSESGGTSAKGLAEVMFFCSVCQDGNKAMCLDWVESMFIPGLPDDCMTTCLLSMNQGHRLSV